MNKIIYSKKPLFSAVGNNTIFVHSVCLRPYNDKTITTNSYKKIFPASYVDYSVTCELYRKKKILESLIGKSFWMGYPDCKQRISFIFVSRKIGVWQDSDNLICNNTEKAIRNLLNTLPASIEVHCNKLNYENFKVPWVRTERVINKVLKDFPRHKFVVHE